MKRAAPDHNKPTNSPAVEIRLPASTSNLGAGFDCFGLALKLYITIRATVLPSSRAACRVRTISGEENATLPRASENLIYRAMAYTAKREGVTLPPIRLAVHNEIPITRGLGGSAAAIVGGIKAFGLLHNRRLTDDQILRYATEFEGHPDNVAATLLGGFVVTCTTLDKVIALKRSWPLELKIVVVSPAMQLETKLARLALPRLVSHADAVHNLQRTALFNAALSENRPDLFWEAMKDRLHQAKRQTLIPGLAEALALPRIPGLLGLALSGGGPSVLAIANDNFDEIGKRIADCFHRRSVPTVVRRLDVDNEGCQTRVLRAAGRQATGS